MDTNKDTRPESKTEQAALLELQMKVADKARIPDILTIATGFIIILALFIAMIIIPDESFSEQENRVLQEFPAISSDGKFLDRLVEGKFSSEMAKYLADQFPLRNTFVGIKGMAEIALLKGENNGVILAKNNYIITKDSEITIDCLKSNIDNIAQFARVMGDMQTPVTLAAAGRSIDALSMYMPANYPMDNSVNLCASCNGLAGAYSKDIKNLEYVDLISALKILVEKGGKGQLYYRTDHHWTTLGAYYAYVEIIKSFKEDSLVPLPLSAFTAEDAAKDFYGTTWSKAGMKWIEPDVLQYFRYDGDEDFVVTIKDTGKTYNGFYDRTYLDKKDKYSSFISGNNSRVDITKPGETRPKLLVIKDSFAHAVVPFLAYHYDLIVLDYRYYTDSAAQLIFNENIDRVLFLHNLANLSEDNIYGAPEDDEEETASAGITYGMLMYGVDTALNNYKRSQYPIRGIYINNNPIEDYVIVIPTEEKDSRKYYINAAESLREIISERSGIEIEIVRTDDWSELDKIIAFTAEGLPAGGFVRIATEGNNLIFRCNIDDRNVGGAGYAAGRFIDKYLRKSTGSFNFGDNFIYSDVGDSVIMIRPN